MALILTFLGKSASGCSTVAIATAKKLAASGSRVLLVSQDSTPSFDALLNMPAQSFPTEIEPNFELVNLKSSQLLSEIWTEFKDLEAKYLKFPTFKSIYGQELGILPGMDEALALNALRKYQEGGTYDVIIYDGNNTFHTLRMFGIPGILNWYLERFRQIFTESDLGKTLVPLIQPLISTILNTSWTLDDLDKVSSDNILQEGNVALKDSNRVAAYLITTEDKAAIATAKYFWGGAYQVGLSVKGVIINQSSELSVGKYFDFGQLESFSLPKKVGNNWKPLIEALPDFLDKSSTPLSINIDTATSQIKIFLPGFEKKQVKLTQSVSELTIEAGDQRRKIYLPNSLTGKVVKSAKFRNNYLVVSL
ncbi:Get3/ArsA fold putative tail anchor-mediating ATPase NosAFP [Candidatus Atelocyanobacterium thalassae]|uniref:Arsenic-transporting ATPase n=1 Tax=cyanobacterium endosymbiont of Braarudosphaera bigelowii TaxID=1285375 RepID=A0ABN6K1B7_9CHRO|nr:ArsA family ATPase [Candidatus Atelocyanobacterium thalassa]BDA40344.1 hypothetical protein CPARK_000118200 [cyanobacterium endosymbiont of Braarudosphaera bigelowii]